MFLVFNSCLNTYREVLIRFSPDPFNSSLVHLYSSDTFTIMPSSSQFLRYRNSYFQFEFKMMSEQYIEGFADLTRPTFCFANIQLGSLFIVSEWVSERVRGRVPVKVWEPLHEVLQRECLNINIHDHWKCLIKHKWFTVIWVISRRKCMKYLPGPALLMWEIAVFFVLHDHKIRFSDLSVKTYEKNGHVITHLQRCRYSPDTSTVLSIVSFCKLANKQPEGPRCLHWQVYLHSIYQKKHYKVLHTDTFKHNKGLECQFWNWLYKTQVQHEEYNHVKLSLK